jgi:hypothetical protein
MIIPTVTSLGSGPTAHPQHAHCGHTRHVGACPACQRAAQRRSEAQFGCGRGRSGDVGNMSAADGRGGRPLFRLLGKGSSAGGVLA